MSYPLDILLPSDAKYYSYVDDTALFNSNFDVIWSYQFKISTDNAESQYGFATYIMPDVFNLDVLPGHYIGSADPSLYIDESTILLEGSGAFLLESGGYILLEDGTTTNLPFSGHLVHISFDSTGLYALSSVDNDGISHNDVIPNSLIVRDYNNHLVFNSPLSAMTDNFDLVSDDYQTLRFRYSNQGGVLYIDYHDTTTTSFTTLTSINLGYKLINTSDTDNVKCGFSFCSPLSTDIDGLGSTFYMKNFHIEGTSASPTTEVVPMTAISPRTYSTYTAMTGVTANPE